MSSTTTTPQQQTKRAIKRKLDDSILLKAREALGLPQESQDVANDPSEPTSLKWRKPRHNTEEGKVYIQNKEKRRKEDEDAGKISKRITTPTTTPTKKDDKKNSKKKKTKKKKKKNVAATTITVPETLSSSGKNPESEKKHGMEALSYLQLWSTNRDHWKFEKLKQTWLLKNGLDVNLVDDKRFELLVDYIGSVKGGARQATLKEMQSIATKYEMSGDDNDNHESSEKGKSSDKITQEMYDRARQIVQMLADD